MKMHLISSTIEPTELRLYFLIHTEMLAVKIEKNNLTVMYIDQQHLNPCSPMVIYIFQEMLSSANLVAKQERPNLG